MTHAASVVGIGIGTDDLAPFNPASSSFRNVRNLDLYMPFMVTS